MKERESLCELLTWKHEQVSGLSASIEIPANEHFLSGTAAFIDAFALSRGVSKSLSATLRQGFIAVAEFFHSTGEREKEIPPLKVEISEKSGRLFLMVHYRGIPVPSDEMNHLDLFLQKHSVSPKAFARIDRAYCGREGQIVTLEMSMGDAASGRVKASVEDPAPESFGENDFEIRKVCSNEADSISRLFYKVYGYDYIRELVYFPDEIRAMMNQGNLISFAAVSPNGRFLGHVGMTKKSDSPQVWEPCLGVTDPEVNSRGLFRGIFDATMEFAKTLEVSYFFFDFVTNHDLSQRLINRYGCLDTALMLGCQSAKTQARLSRFGLDCDPVSTDRFSILYGIIPGLTQPFGEEITLPDNLGKLLGFLIEPLGLGWIPASRFAVPKIQGEYRVTREPEQEAVFFDCYDPGSEAVEKIITDWLLLKKEGYVYAAVDIPVEPSGLAKLYDMLARQDFFVAGFVPHANSEKLALRMQTLVPKKLEFNEIKVFSHGAKRLLEIIRRQYERSLANA